MDGNGRHDGGTVVSVFDFLKVFGASLTGLTAILTAAGFLAERSRLAMLGLPSATFDLQLYVETGAFFLALLPVVVGLGSVLVLISWVDGALEALIDAMPGLALVVVVLALASGVLFLVRARRGRSSASSAREEVRSSPERRLHRARSWFSAQLHAGNRQFRRIGFGLLLGAALVIQIMTVGRELAVLDVRDVLFERLSEAEVASASPSSDEFSQAVRSGNGGSRTAMRLFGGIVLATVLNAGVFYHVVRNRLSRTRPRGRKAVLYAWVTATLLLLVSQITLLPYSYGVLLSRNNYPEVCPMLAEGAANRQGDLPEVRVSLVHQTGSGFYFYSRSVRKMWYVPRPDVTSILYFGRRDVLASVDPISCPVEMPP